MKSLVRKIAIYSFTLYVLPFIVPGVEISGGLDTLFLGGLLLALMFLVLKPILNLLSFPINLLTLGLFSVFTNVLIIYLLTIFLPNVSITEFTYQRVEIFGFITPVLFFNTFYSYIYTAFMLSIIESSLVWLLE